MKNRIDLPSPRTPPPEILRGLREVDPAAELHWFEGPGIGKPYWVLGVVKDRNLTPGGNAARREAGARLIERAAKRTLFPWGLHAMGTLMLHDFAFIVNWEEDQDGPLSALVEYFREADWQFRQDGGESRFNQHLDEAEMGPELRARQATARDMVTSDARAIYRYVFKGRRTVQVPSTLSLQES